MPSSRTPEGHFNRCPVCQNEICIVPSHPLGDAPCPCCGQLLWFPENAGMESSGFFVGAGAVYELDVTTKSEAIEALVRKLCELCNFGVHEVDGLVRSLMHREEMGSTGIGCGVAVPHAKHETINRLVGIIGYIPDGVDFESLDREPVKRIFLFLSPPHKPGEHLRALQQISQLLRTDS